ncbi:MAG: HesA/MoeB/ThiF family protein [Fusobacteriaceae bacterium]
MEVTKVKERYSKNIGTFTIDEQKILNQKSVLVVGLGGLGGIVIEGLARLGVKKIGICDFDVFCESNLNRQLLSSEKNIGKEKILEAEARILSINKSVSIRKYGKFPEQKILEELSLKEYDIVIDCVDNYETKLELENICTRENIFLIYGAIGGLFGQLAVITRNNKIIEFQKNMVNSIEKNLGNPFFTPAIVGTFEVYLCCKVLLGKKYLRNGFYYIDLDNFSLEEIVTS